MKRLNHFIILLVAITTVLFTSCDKDDNTGYSSLTPTSPTISIKSAGDVISLIETDKTYEFEVTLSEAQVVDVWLYAKVVSGTATDGEDYVIDNSNSRVYIPAYSTKGVLKVKIMSDEIAEGKEDFTLQIGDEKTANAALTPITVKFNIDNLTANDLSIDMSWETDAATAIGMDLDGNEVVDMRLLVVDKDGEILDGADGASYESFTMLDGDFPDGEYFIAADIFETVNAGDFNAPVTLDISLDFNQLGVINGSSLSFPAVMTNEYPCDAYRTYLAKVTKSGTTYTMEKAISYMTPERIPWFGLDTEFEYPSQVETVMGCEYLIFGLGHGWMEDFWGEEIIEEGNVSFTIDEAGNVNIPFQHCFTTLYDGAEYPYSISGTGTYIDSEEFPVMIITYVLDQDGFNPSQWCLENEYMANGDFTAVLTLDPNATPGKANNGKMKFLPKLVKPIR